MFHFYSPWISQKSKGFLTFSEGTNWNIVVKRASDNFEQVQFNIQQIYSLNASIALI